MATKLVLVSLLLFQLGVIAFCKHKPHKGYHRRPWVLTRGIPSYPRGGISGGPAGGIPGGPAEGISSQLGGSTGGILAPSKVTRRAQGGNGGKKWCIGNINIKKGFLKAAFEELCKEVNCSPTGPQGLCYDESIWSKASYAMNLRYQKNGRQDSDCNLDGRAQIVTIDPSWGKCVLISS